MLEKVYSKPPECQGISKVYTGVISDECWKVDGGRALLLWKNEGQSAERCYDSGERRLDQHLSGP